MNKVVLGLSGGVDSAVAARLLQNEGYAVHGLFLDIGLPDARRDAEDTADFLGVPLTVLDIRDALETHVCAPFAESYLRGETPNPCILCNPAVKFAALLAEADRIGAEKIATGHYARSENGNLYRALSAKDQSYMLCRLQREEVRRLLLPLGSYEKPRIRAMAEEFGIPVAQKPDSMEICFIPDQDYIGWLRRRAELPRPGRFIWNGTAVGNHEGIHCWTVGQRIPGVYGSEGTKLYISALDPASGTITVCPDAALFRSEVLVRDFRWLSEPPALPLHCTVKVRHTRTGEVPCIVCPAPSGRLRLVCETPVRAPAPGQCAALYDGDRLLGGGFITYDLPKEDTP